MKVSSKGRLVGISTFVLCYALISLPNMASAAIAVDGSVSNAQSSTNPATATLTTGAGEVIYLFSKAAFSNAQSVSSISDTAGLTWVKRQSQFNGGSSLTDFEAWYAISSGSLSGDVISVTYSTTPVSSRVTVVGVSGASLSSPFDSNVSIPAQTATTSNVQTIGLTISTSNANDLLLAELGCTTSCGTVTRPSGFSQVLSTGSVTDVGYATVASIQSNVTETYSWSATAAPAGMQLDAIKAAPNQGMLLNQSF